MKIERCKGDDEIAHSFEDELFYAFVDAIQNEKLKQMLL